jgi:hypothetical protein
MNTTRRKIAILAIVPIAILTNIFDLLSDPDQYNLSDLLMAKFITTASSSEISLFLFTVSDLYFLFYFNIIFGGCIYQYFRVGSVYTFARITNRKTWYRKELFALLFRAFLFALLLLMTYMALCLPQSTGRVEMSTLVTFVLLLFFITLIVTISTTLINLISLKHGSSKAFMIVYALELFFVFLIYFSLQSQFLLKYRYIMVLNPFWGLTNIGNMPGSILSVLCSGLYLLLLLYLLYHLGAIYITKADIAIEDTDHK